VHGMASVILSLGFEADEESLVELLDALHGVVQDIAGDSPSIGIEVDGEHRDPDEPTSDLFS
jgi:hypothetical protein